MAQKRPPMTQNDEKTSKTYKNMFLQCLEKVWMGFGHIEKICQFYDSKIPDLIRCKIPDLIRCGVGGRNNFMNVRNPGTEIWPPPPPPPLMCKNVKNALSTLEYP